jgi:prephenate dehydrogenase
LDQVETVAIVGVGLIGGSIGMALRAGAHVQRVVGIGRNVRNLEEAVRLGAIDNFTTELARGVAEADVAVVCTPVSRIADDVRNVAAHGPDKILVTDAGSTKLRLVEAIEKDEHARAVFVGGHPIAGSERSGVAHARADLFEGRACVLTPTSRTPDDRLVRARAFWSCLGCRLIELDPAEHDRALGLTSHLPHAVAAALAASVPTGFLGLAAGAYRDCTRVAGADAELWTSIFRENKEPVLRALDAFQGELTEFVRALRDDDEHALRRWWQNANANRSTYEALSRPMQISD